MERVFFITFFKNTKINNVLYNITTELKLFSYFGYNNNNIGKNMKKKNKKNNNKIYHYIHSYIYKVGESKERVSPIFFFKISPERRDAYHVKKKKQDKTKQYKKMKYFFAIKYVRTCTCTYTHT